MHGILQARILEWVVMAPPGNLSDPGIEPTSLVTPALQADSLLLSYQGIPDTDLHSLIPNLWVAMCFGIEGILNFRKQGHKF